MITNAYSIRTPDVKQAVTLQMSTLGNSIIGYNVLYSHGLPSGEYWYWLGVGVLLLYAVGFNILVTLTLAYLKRTS